MIATLPYIVRNLRRRRTRTLMGVLGICLTLALLTAIQVGLDSVSISYLDLVSLQAGKADLVITRTGGDPFNPRSFSPSVVSARLSESPKLLGLAPRWFGIVQVQFRGQEHHAVLIGVNPQRERELGISGLSPEPVLEGEACALSASLATRLKMAPGSRFAVRSASTYGEAQVRLETVLERQLVLPPQIRDYVVVNEATARQILGESEQIHALAGAFREPHSFYDARDLHASVLKLKEAGAAIASQIGPQYDVRLPKAAAITTFREFSSPLRAVFGVFALLALTITGLLIYSLISVSVEERVREYGILRTLGAKRGDIFRLVLGESFLMCFLGVVPGVIGGAGLAVLFLKLAGVAIAAKGGTLAVEISPATLLLTIAGGAALSIGSALVPAWHATRWRIVDALDPLRRGQVAPPPAGEGRANRPLLASGLAISVLSVVVFFVLPTAVFSGNPSLIGAVLLCLLVAMVLGFTLASVGILPWVQMILARFLRPVFGAAAELAGRNLERHRRRHTTTALLFTLSVSMVIFMASLVALASRTALSLVEQTHGADVRIEAGRIESDSIKSDFSRVEGVNAVSEARYLHSRSEAGIAYDVVISDLVGMRNLWVVPFGVDSDLSKVVYRGGIVCDAGTPDALGELGSHKVLSDRDNSAATNAVPTVILSLAIARFLDVTDGDQVQLSFRLGSERSDARFRVAAIYSALPGFRNVRGRVALAVGSGLLMSLENFKIMTRSAPSEAFQGIYFIQGKGDEKAHQAAAAKIREDFDVRYRFGVSCAAEQKKEARVLYWATQVLFGLLLAVAVVIAVFALIASMASSVMERHREIGVLKALGLRRANLFRLFLAEAVVLTLSAGIAGGVIGFLLAWFFVLQASLLMELATTFTLPYLTFLATVLISLLAGALAAHLPTRTLLHKSAADILRAA